MNPLRAIPTSGEELEKLRRDLDLNQVEMGKLLGVSREWVSRLEGGGAPISDFMRMKLTALVNSGENLVHNLAEPPGPYSAVSEFPESSIRVSPIPSATASRTGKPVRINPAHQPRPAEPTPQACIDYFLTYLKAAEHAPGGVGAVWWKLQKNFPLDEFEPTQKP